MKPLKILLADDSKALCATISADLESNGHKITVVHSGEEAITSYRESLPEVVLIDLEMPGIGGIKTIQELRKIPVQRWVPIIVITASTDEGSLLESFMAGADDFMSKPISPLILDIRIQSMMRIAFLQRSAATLVDHVIEGVIKIDRVGRILAFNRAAEKIFGYQAQEVLGKNVKMLMPEPYREQHDGYIENYINTGKAKIINNGREVTGIKKSGQTFPMHLGVTEAATPEEQFFVGLVRDLTEEKALKAKLQEGKRFLSDLVEHSSAVTFVKDLGGRYQLVNQRYEEVVGLPRSEVIGKTDLDLFPKNTAETYRKIDIEVMRTGQSRQVRESIKKTEQEFYFLSTKFPVRDSNGRIMGVCGMATDITELLHAQKELERLSYYDELTGLPNRRSFMIRANKLLEQSVRTGPHFSILMLDIDHFKKINDTYGHHAGDLALKEIAKLITGSLREGDFAGRLGGEEFAVALSNTSIETAMHIAERLREAVQKSAILLENEEISATISIGVTHGPSGNKHLEEFLMDADQALYSAKRQGRNQVVLSEPQTKSHSVAQPLP